MEEKNEVVFTFLFSFFSLSFLLCQKMNVQEWSGCSRRHIWNFGRNGHAASSGWAELVHNGVGQHQSSKLAPWIMQKEEFNKTLTSPTRLLYRGGILEDVAFAAPVFFLSFPSFLAYSARRQWAGSVKGEDLAPSFFSLRNSKCFDAGLQGLRLASNQVFGTNTRQPQCTVETWITASS